METVVQKDGGGEQKCRVRNHTVSSGGVDSGGSLNPGETPWKSRRRGRQIPRQALPDGALGSAWLPVVGAGCPYTPHSHLTHTAPHSTLKPPTHGQHCTYRAGRCSQLSILLRTWSGLQPSTHSFTPHPRRLHPPPSLKHPTGLISSGRFPSLPLLPSL